MLQNAELLLQQGLHISDVVSGYTKAAQKALEVLEALGSAKVEDIKNVDQVATYLKSAIAAKQYGYENFLSPIIAKACIDVLPKNPQHFNVDNVQIIFEFGSFYLVSK